jgi:hypothetical protein
MKITIEILEKAKAFAKNHIENIDNYKDTESDAVEQGKRFSKLMGYEYSHVTQQIGAVL